MRYWLLTNTTYGTWLPGDRRGSVTSVREIRDGEVSTPFRLEHDIPGEPYEEPLPGLHRVAIEQMNGPAIYLDKAKAELVLGQFQETAAYRGWTLHAVAIMANHFHMVVSVGGDPEPRKILADFKAYGSRSLNCRYGKPPSVTWWTTNGSKRKLKDESARLAAIRYALYKQAHALVLWSPETGRIV